MTGNLPAALAGLWIVLAADRLLAADEPRPAITQPARQEAELADSVAWRIDYRAALAEARQRRSMALVWFFDPQRPDENETLQRDLFRQSEVSALLGRYVPVKLSVDATITVFPPEGEPRSGANDAPTVPAKELRLLDHPAFEEMLGQSGVALIDLRDPASPYFHQVVSVLPFGRKIVRPQQLTALLSLPDGSLTQRTLIWAVWTHAESPQSASQKASPLLMREAASHAAYQSSIGTGGHHHWGERFQRINQQLPAGLLAQEICAESWPGQRLVEAAEECVHSWRQSDGHWDAVRTSHPLFGYDMKRGANGIWYAAGIFGRRH